MNEQEYAGFWIRVGATLIDALIVMIIIFPILTLIYGSVYWHGNFYYSPYYGYVDNTHFFYGFWNFFFQFAVPLTATIWFWIKFQATPGKMATSLRVVDAKTGKPLSIGQAVGRYFAYIVSLLPLGLGIFWIVFDKRKQGWHDKLAGSVVVRSHAKEAVVFED